MGGRSLFGKEKCIKKEKKASHGYIEDSNKWTLKTAKSEEKCLRKNENVWTTWVMSLLTLKRFFKKCIF